MNLIAAVDENWAIGYQNKLLVRIPDDQKYFQKMTSGKVVVMGRKTLDSFPNQAPLKNRTNLVLTRDPHFKRDGVQVAHSVEEMLELIEQYPTGNVFIIGGDSVYRQFLPYCDTAYVTKIDRGFYADAYFPNLDEDPEWEMVSESEEGTYFDMEYVFTVYKRKEENS